MKTATISEALSQPSKVFGGEESVLLTRRGKPVGVFQPLPRPSKRPIEVRRKLYAKSSTALAKLLREKGITEEQVDRAIADLFGKTRSRH